MSRLQVIACDGNLSNLILSDPFGTDKTTSIFALAHELLRPNYKKAILELNALDDSLTSGAQQALRRTMEIYSTTILLAEGKT